MVERFENNKEQWVYKGYMKDNKPYGSGSLRNIKGK